MNEQNQKNIVGNKYVFYCILISILFFPVIILFIQNYLIPFNSLLLLRNETLEQFKIKQKLYSNYKIIKILETLNSLPIDIKKKSLVYIPRSNYYYWNLLPSARLISQCNSESRIIPALIGMAMIDGKPIIKNCVFHANKYESLNKINDNLTQSRFSNSPICEKAISQGFSNIIVIDIDAEENLIYYSMNC